MDNAFTLADVLAILRRRWALMALPVLIGVPLTVTVVMLQPSVYAATARILIEAQQIPDELARSTVTQSATERIALIQQRLLTRQNVLEIAQQYNVFRHLPDATPTEIVEQMRQSTVIAGNAARSARRGNTTTTGVDIVFRARDAQTAARVANELVTRVLAENTQARTERASSTVAFFEEEVRRLTQQVDGVSSQIVAFKTQNEASLPQTLESRRAELTGLRERRAARDAQRLALEARRRDLQRSLEIGSGGLVTDQQRSADLAELNRLRAQLVQQRATLSESHPTVRVLAARINALETAISQPAATPTGTAATPGLNTSGQAMMTLAEIERIDGQLSGLDNQDELDEARAVDLERSISETPAVEVALANLERTLSALQLQLRDASIKQAQAQTGERLEVSQQAERFEVVEQAIAPDRPVSPNRPRLIAVGSAMSVALGIGFAVLAELLNRAVRTDRDLARQLGVRPIVSIPYIPTAGETARRRWGLRLLLLVFVVGVPAAIIAVDQYVTPLSVLFERTVDTLRLRPLLLALGIRL
jgi:uncharacterized protein involved in exopolysaccharide biosynthesis